MNFQLNDCDIITEKIKITHYDNLEKFNIFKLSCTKELKNIKQNKIKKVKLF